MNVRKTLIASGATAAIALAVGGLAASPVRTDATEGPTTAIVGLHIEGMTCPSCKVAVRTALKKLDGVKDAKVDVAAKSATVDFDPTKVTPPQLVDAVNRLGYQASLPELGGTRGAP